MEEESAEKIVENMKGYGKRSEGGSITLKKTTLWKASTFLFAALFVVSLFTGGFGFDGGTGQAIADDSGGVPVEPEQVAGPSAEGLIEEGDPVLGEADAAITVVEFSDFQCSFCARAAFGTVADLKLSDAFKNGEVNFVYKHFPLNSIHPQAQKAAEASECANRQDMFWEYHDLLFANQNSLDVASLKSYAEQIGLDMDTFNSCLDDDEATAEVNKETQQATAAGGRGTPYFVVVNNDNGQTTAVSGAVPFAQLEAGINSVK